LRLWRGVAISYVENSELVSAASFNKSI
jgi:hypothetical protein